MDVAAYKKPISSEWVTDYILWTFSEATCLLAGCNPVSAKVFYDVLLPHDHIIAKIYRQLKDAARTDALVTVPPYSKEKPYSETGHKYDLRATPKEVIAWARSREYEISQKLESLQADFATLDKEIKTSCTMSSEKRPAGWKDEARKIADELEQKDRNAGVQSSKEDMSHRIAAVAVERGITGPHGKLTAANILREALQGNKWERQKRSIQ